MSTRVIARGWAEGRVVEILYDPGTGSEKRTRVHPYFLEPDAALRSVYLIGYDEPAAAMRTYKVERIQSATLTQDRIRDPGGLRPGRLARQLVGNWSAGSTPPVRVRLHFESSVAHRVREAVWHRSQELTELPKGRLELTVTVNGIVENPAMDHVVGRRGRGSRARGAAHGGCELGASGCRALCGLRSRPSSSPTTAAAPGPAMSAAISWVRHRTVLEWVCLVAGLAVFGYVGWDGALWDARFQLLLHLLAIGAIAGLAILALRGGAVPHTPIDLPVVALVLAFGVATASAMNVGMSLRATAAIAAYAAMLYVALICIRYRPSWVGIVTAVPVLVLSVPTLVSLLARRVERTLPGRRAFHPSGSRASPRPSARWPCHRS